MGGQLWGKGWHGETGMVRHGIVGGMVIRHMPWHDTDGHLSITQSAPSNTALATSLASARVGRGFWVMVSSIWVAQITGFPARLHLAIIIFWARNTWTRPDSEC